MARPYLGGSTAGIKAVSADVTLQIADTGKKIVVDASSALNFTITLPATASSYLYAEKPPKNALVQYKNQ